MQAATPTVYTDVSREQFDSFVTQSRAKGLNLSGAEGDVTFDLIPMHYVYNEPTKTLTFTYQEPYWMSPGTTAGVLHSMVAMATLRQAIPVKNGAAVSTDDTTSSAAARHTQHTTQGAQKAAH